MFRILLAALTASYLFSSVGFAQEELMNSWPEFTPYDNSQADESATEWEFSLENVRYQGMIAPKRFLSVDRFADKYPSMTPYQYTLNNPVRFIDVNGDTVKFDDPNLQNQHNTFYNQKDKNGNYINTQYRAQYDQLHASDVVYRVQDVQLGQNPQGNPVLGTITTTGTEVLIQLDVQQGANIGQHLSHEFVHGQQFERGELVFGVTQSGQWASVGTTIGTELQAFQNQQTPEQWWSTTNQQNNIQTVQQLYPQYVGKERPAHLPLPPAYGKRTVVRNQSFFGVFPTP